MSYSQPLVSGQAPTQVAYQVPSAPPAQYVPTRYVQPQQQQLQPHYAPQQYAPPRQPHYAQPQHLQQPQQSGRGGAVGMALLAGLFPIFNPIFLPIQMTVFIIMIIVLLFKGYSFWTAALLSWLIPGLIAAVFNYIFISSMMSVSGYGEAPK